MSRNTRRARLHVGLTASARLVPQCAAYRPGSPAAGTKYFAPQAGVNRPAPEAGVSKPAPQAGATRPGPTAGTRAI